MTSYVSVAEIAEFCRIPDDADDAWLALIAASVTATVDQACNRSFQVAVSDSRAFFAEFDRIADRYVVFTDDFVSVDSAVDSDGNDLEFVVDGNHTLVFDEDPGEVLVTADFGYDAVPESVKLACLLQASRLVMRRDSPLGVAGSPGSEMRLLARLDPDVETLLRPYKRRWFSC